MADIIELEFYFLEGRPGRVAEKLVVLPVLLPGNKLFFRFLQVQVCIEESVV